MNVRRRVASGEARRLRAEIAATLQVLADTTITLDRLLRALDDLTGE